MANFEANNETRTDKLRRLLIDKFHQLWKITQSPGVVVTDDTDAYLRQDLIHGRATHQIKNADKYYVRPLQKDILRAGVKMGDLEDYLYAKHAPERNEHIRNINKKFSTEEKQITDEDGNIVDEVVIQKHGSGMSDEEAQAILDDFEKRGLTKKMERLAKQVYHINKMKIKILREAGLENKQTLDNWEKYENYVPLKGIGEKDPRRARTGKGFDIRGPESKRALGRNSKAANILSESILSLREAIVRAEKNRVGQAFLNFVRQNPNKGLWEINKIEKMQYFDKKSGEVKERVDPLYQKSNNVMSVKENGEEIYITIHDKALAGAMKNLGPDKSGKILQTMASVSRYLSIVRTMLSPGFVPTNLARDIQTAVINLSVEESNGLALQVVKDVPKAMRGVWKALRDKEPNEWSKWYEEFAQSGGKIGFLGLENLEQIQKQLINDIKLMKPGTKSTARRAWRDVWELIKDTNESVENSVRLSTYVNLRKNGVSKDRAAQAAKNVTVNFNRKGELGTAMNALWIFSNAGIQGTARMAQIAKTKKGAIILGSIAVTSTMLSQMNRILGGDDDDGENYYDKIADHIKESNLIIMYPGGKGEHFKYPLPYGYNVFWALGQGVDMAMHNPDGSVEGAKLVASAMANSFNPIGTSSTLLQTVSPTAFQWLADLGLNKNFFGGPIYKENKYGPKVAKSESYFKSTSEISKKVAQSINKWAGGTKYDPSWADFSPDVMDYTYDYLTGGAGAFFRRVIDLAGKVGTGKTPKVREIPIARRFMGAIHEHHDMNIYYDNLQQLKQIKAQADEFKEIREFDSLSKWSKAHDKELFLLKSSAAIKRLQVAVNKAEDAKNEKATKELEEILQKRVKEFNRKYNVITGRIKK